MILSRSMEAALEYDRLSDDEKLPGKEELRRYCESLRFERGASDHTVRNYRIDILDYLRWAKRSKLDPFTLSHKQMRRYLAELDSAKYARSTVNRRLSSLKGFFSWMNVEGIIDSDPASALSGPKSQSRLPKVISADDMVRFLSVHSKCDVKGGKRNQSIEDMRDQAVLELLYASGARVSEISGLKSADVDLKHRQIKVFGKGAKERIVPIHDLAVDAMNAYALYARAKLLKGKASEFFFVSSRGNRFSDQAIRRMFKATLRAAGLDESLSPHAMRHTFASDMLAGDADLRSVQEMLGHASLSTTQIYTHISPERLKEIHQLAHPRG